MPNPRVYDQYGLISPGLWSYEWNNDMNFGMDPNHYVLEYGPKTYEQLNDIECHFKLFWDGSLSLYKDNVLSSAFNKHMVAKLLDFRTRT